jgi:hypothetical protein
MGKSTRTSEANAAGVAAVSGVGATNLAAEEGALDGKLQRSDGVGAFRCGIPNSWMIYFMIFMENLTKMDDKWMINIDKWGIR